MQKFQPGDRVRYVDDTSCHPVIPGRVYTVGSRTAADNGVFLLEAPHMWFLDCRFELVESQRSRSRTLPEDSEARKRYPLFTGLLLYFPAALAEVAALSKAGNDKHNPGEPMHHARSKSTDHEDCIIRHGLDAHEGDGRDENGVPHVVMRAWRALAAAQEWLEQHDGAPKAPAAKD